MPPAKKDVVKSKKLPCPVSKMRNASAYLLSASQRKQQQQLQQQNQKQKQKPVAVSRMVSSSAYLKREEEKKKLERQKQAPVVVFSNRVKDVDVCCSCNAKMTTSLRAVLSIQPVKKIEGAFPPIVFCDICRTPVQVCDGPNTMTMTLLGLKPQFEAAQPGARGPASLGGLVAEALEAPRTQGDLSTLKQCLHLAGFKQSLITKIFDKVSKH